MYIYIHVYAKKFGVLVDCFRSKLFSSWTLEFKIRSQPIVSEKRSTYLRKGFETVKERVAQ